MVVRPGLTSIPILSSLPDIPLLYHSNPALSFLVDAMALSALFGTLLAPLGAQVLGRHGDANGQKAGKKFGAILGVILGLSSAFALRRAGVTLFEYWLTTVIAALLIGGTLYMFLNKLLAGKYKIITGLISFLIAWMVLDFWFVATGSETTRNIFGFVSLLTPMIVLLYFLYIMLKIRGGPGGGGGGGGGGGRGGGGPAPAPAPTPGATEGVLEVTSGDPFESAGPVGGPFSPSTMKYQLRNIGNATLDFSVTRNELWLNVTPSRGALTPGRRTTVVVTLTSVANTLPKGVYTDVITFTNATNSRGDTTRDATLITDGKITPKSTWYKPWTWKSVRGLKDWWDNLDKQQQVAWKSIEEAGNAVATVEADLDAIVKSWEKLEDETKNASAGLGFALEEGDKLKIQLGRGRTINTTAYKDAITVQLAQIDQKILKPAQKTITLIGNVLKLKVKIESAMQDFKTLKKMIDISEVRAQVEQLPDGPRKEEVRKAFKQVIDEIARLDTTLTRLDSIVNSLEAQRLPFFVNRATEFETFAADVKKRLETVSQHRNALTASVPALDKDQTVDQRTQAIDATQQLIQSFISALAQLEHVWADIEQNTKVIQEVRKGIDLDLRQWKKIYSELVRPAIAAIAELKETLKKALERAQAPPPKPPTPPPAPVAPAAPAARPQPPTPPPAAPEEDIPTLAIIIQSIKEQKQVLVVLQTIMTKFVSEIEFTFKKPLQRKILKGSEKQQEELKETASKAMEEAAQVAKFDEAAVQKAKDLAAELHAAAGDIANRLVLPNVPQPEIKQLQAIQANLANFEKFEQGVLVPMIANLEETMQDKAVDAVLKGKTEMVNAEQLTKRVQDQLGKLLKQFKQAIEWLTFEEATLTRALKKPPRARPSGMI